MERACRSCSRRCRGRGLLRGLREGAQLGQRSRSATVRVTLNHANPPVRVSTPPGYTRRPRARATTPPPVAGCASSPFSAFGPWFGPRFPGSHPVWRRDAAAKTTREPPHNDAVLVSTDCSLRSQTTSGGAEAGSARAVEYCNSLDRTVTDVMPKRTRRFGSLKHEFRSKATHSKTTAHRHMHAQK